MTGTAWRRKVGGAAGLLVAVCLLASDLITSVEGRVLLLLGSGIAGSLMLTVSGERSGRGGPAADGAAFAAAAALGSLLSSRGWPGLDLPLGEFWLAFTVLSRPGSLLPGARWISALWLRDARATGLSLAANAVLLSLLSVVAGAGGLFVWLLSFPPMLFLFVSAGRRKAEAAEKESAPGLLQGPDGRFVLSWEGRSMDGIELSEEGSVAVLNAESLLSRPGGPKALGVLGEALYASGYRALLVVEADPGQEGALELEGFARRGRGWHRILRARGT